MSIFIQYITGGGTSNGMVGKTSNIMVVPVFSNKNKRRSCGPWFLGERGFLWVFWFHCIVFFGGPVQTRSGPDQKSNGPVRFLDGSGSGPETGPEPAGPAFLDGSGPGPEVRTRTRSIPIYGYGKSVPVK